MKRCIPFAAMLVLPLLVLAADPAPNAASKPPAAPTQLPAPPDFGWLADLVGSCWVARIPENRLHTQCYSRQFDRFIRGAITVSTEVDGTWRPIFAGDSVFASEAGRRLAYYTWGSDGGHRQLEARLEGDLIVFPTAARPPQRVTQRSVWKRLDDDTFEVSREKASEDGKSWTEELKVTNKRTGTATK
jgi:hypothetical protein